MTPRDILAWVILSGGVSGLGLIGLAMWWVRRIEYRGCFNSDTLRCWRHDDLPRVKAIYGIRSRY